MAWLHNFLEFLEIDFGGDKGTVLAGLFFGIPIGSILGIVLSEKLIYKAHGWNAFGIGLAASMGLISVFFGIRMMDHFGSKFIFFIPFLTVLICIVAYQIVTFFK
jgi:hypothetical protein